MLGIIGGNWFRPDVGSIPNATIHFVIARNGTIRDVEITQASGSSTFDRAARRAVIESNPLPPLPFQYTGTELGVHLKFN
jgi:TonB family protein